jgi:hypothetical protein
MREFTSPALNPSTYEARNSFGVIIFNVDMVWLKFIEEEKSPSVIT